MGRMKFKVITFLFVGCAAPVLTFAQTADDRIASIMSTYVREDGPGCAVGVVRRGALVYSRGFGLANLEHGVPVTADTVFRIGSVSKQFVAASIALLALRNELDLDANIRSILPSLPQYKHVITVRHLIGHSSGIPDVYKLLELLGHDSDGNFYPSELTLEIIYRLKELNFEPGSKFEYSNAGYLLLAQVVEAVSGQSLRQFVHDNIFAPLSMDNTHFHDDYREIVMNRAYGYGQNSTGQWELRNSNFYVVGDGGVFTTVTDLAQWERNFYEHQLGRGPELQQMMTAPLEYSVSEPVFIGKEVDYGFGLFLDEHKGNTMIWHPGGWAGFQAASARFPNLQVSLIMLCNKIQAGMRDVFLEVTNEILGEN